MSDARETANCRPYIASTACTRSHIATTKQRIIISKIRNTKILVRNNAHYTDRSFTKTQGIQRITLVIRNESSDIRDQERLQEMSHDIVARLHLAISIQINVTVCKNHRTIKYKKYHVHTANSCQAIRQSHWAIESRSSWFTN